MSVFKNVDFSHAHDMVTCCILNHVIEGVEHVEQKVSCIFTMMVSNALFYISH